MSPEIASQLSIQDRLDCIPQIQTKEEGQLYSEVTDTFGQQLCLLKQIDQEIWPSMGLSVPFRKATGFLSGLTELEGSDFNEKSIIKSITEKFCQKITITYKKIYQLNWITKVDIKVLEQTKNPPHGKNDNSLLGIGKLKKIVDQYEDTDDQLLIIKNIAKNKLNIKKTEILLEKLKKQSEQELSQEDINLTIEYVSQQSLENQITDQLKKEILEDDSSFSFQEITSDDSNQTIDLKKEINTLVKELLLENLWLPYLEQYSPYSKIREFYTKIWSEHQNVTEAGMEIGLNEIQSSILLLKIFNIRSCIKNNPNQEYLADQKKIIDDFKEYQSIKDNPEQNNKKTKEQIYEQNKMLRIIIEDLKTQAFSFNEEKYTKSNESCPHSNKEKFIFTQLYFQNKVIGKKNQTLNIITLITSIVNKRSLSFIT